jgi:DNA-binding NtrC family response regulator
MLTGKTIAVIDDEAAICFALQRFFAKRGARVLTAGNWEQGRQYCAQADLLFLDVQLGQHDGLELLPEIRSSWPDLAVVVITAYGSLEMVERAMQNGAFEYVTKPLDMHKIELLVRQALAARPDTLPAAPDTADYYGFVGNSAPMQHLLLQLLRVAAQDVPTLINGETGTGKELAARLLHQKCRRAKGPFVTVNCGALPENLIESELFGYCKGTFTGAVQDKVGLCEAADRGILFLDEIGELPLPAQVKLLRFLDQGRIERLGAVRPVEVDVRVIAATNRDLAEAVKEGRFRADLFYRIAVLQVEMPPLREHRQDIIPLAKYWLEKLPLPERRGLSPAAAEWLQSWSWPGNVRELRNVVLQAALAAQGGDILPEHLPDGIPAGAESAPPGSSAELQRYVEALSLTGTDCLAQATAQLQRALVRRALRECDGYQSAAAAKLGIHRNSLRRILE